MRNSLSPAVLAGLIGGVGFTVSPFITALAFTDKVMVEEATVGVLAASLIAGLSGYLFLLVASRGHTHSDQSGAGTRVWQALLPIRKEC